VGASRGSALSDSFRLHNVLDLVLVYSRKPLMYIPPDDPLRRCSWRPNKGHLLPVEILSEIFRIVVYTWHYSDLRERGWLMLVCRHWYAITVSTPGIPSKLWIRKSTSMASVQAAIQGRRWLLDVFIDPGNERNGQDFNADAFHASFMAAIQEASRWRSLSLHSFPLPGECKAFQIVQRLERLVSFRLDQGCDLGSFFGPLMTAIITTALPHLTKLHLCDLSAVLYVVQPARMRIFCHLRTLVISLNKRMESPADILPSLQRLETFEARHLHLPIYPPDASLPLIQTLRDLRLKSVSVQWMAGKVFPALLKCSITFPHHIGTIRLRPVTMPACTSLAYNSNDLDPLRYFHHLPLDALYVTSGQWNVSRGNYQLVAMCPIVVASAQNLTKLHLYVQCSEQLLAYMLSLVPDLEELTLGLASPNALSEAFFRAFTETSSRSDEESPYEMAAQLCAGLKDLTLYYKRQLRGPERMELIRVFSEIALSHWEEIEIDEIDEIEGVFELTLMFHGSDQSWIVRMPDETLEGYTHKLASIVGIPGPWGIIPLELWGIHPLMEVPFKETEYLWARHPLSISCLSSLHYLVELRVGIKQDILPHAPPSNLPLFRTLRVLEAKSIHPSFLAGQTFHKLEGCRVYLRVESPKLSQGQITQMPVCTRLDVDDLTLLATFNLPRIRELGVSLRHPEFNMIWAKNIVVNSNLSGLELLHVHGWHQQEDLVQVLRFLPVLETLILGSGPVLDADFFGEFMQMDLNETFAPVQSRLVGRASAFLCPMLTSLCIEGLDPTKRRELIPVLKEVVIIRAVGGSPLKTFTLYYFQKGRGKWELIGSNGSFVVERVRLRQVVGPFELKI